MLNFPEIPGWVAGKRAMRWGREIGRRKMRAGPTRDICDWHLWNVLVVTSPKTQMTLSAILLYPAAVTADQGWAADACCWAWGSLIRARFQPDVHHGLHWCAVTEALPSAAGLHTSSFTCSSTLHSSSFSSGSSRLGGRWDKRCHRRGAGVMEAAWNWKCVEMNRTFAELFRIPQVMVINRWALQEAQRAVCFKTNRAFNTMKHRAEYQWQFKRVHTHSLVPAFWYTWNMNIKAQREWNVVFQLKDPVKRVLVRLTFSAPQNQSSLKCLEWSINFFFLSLEWMCSSSVLHFIFGCFAFIFTLPLFFLRKVIRSSVNAINLCRPQLSVAQKGINGRDLALGKLFFMAVIYWCMDIDSAQPSTWKTLSNTSEREGVEETRTNHTLIFLFRGQ